MKITLVLFMILILILAAIPMREVKHAMKNRLGVLSLLRAHLQKLLNAEISFSRVQDFLHIPFFGLLAFLWMKFFARKKFSTKKAIIYTLGVTFIFSIFEEFCQFFIVGRDASLSDLFLNSVGCVAGICLQVVTNKA